MNNILCPVDPSNAPIPSENQERTYLTINQQIKIIRERYHMGMEFIDKLRIRTDALKSIAMGTIADLKAVVSAVQEMNGYITNTLEPWRNNINVILQNIIDTPPESGGWQKIFGGILKNTNSIEEMKIQNGNINSILNKFDKDITDKLKRVTKLEEKTSAQLKRLEGVDDINKWFQNQKIEVQKTFDMMQEVIRTQEEIEKEIKKSNGKENKLIKKEEKDQIKGENQNKNEENQINDENEMIEIKKDNESLQKEKKQIKDEEDVTDIIKEVRDLLKDQAYALRNHKNYNSNYKRNYNNNYRKPQYNYRKNNQNYKHNNWRGFKNNQKPFYQNNNYQRNFQKKFDYNPNYKKFNPNYRPQQRFQGYKYNSFHHNPIDFRNQNYVPYEQFGWGRRYH